MSLKKLFSKKYTIRWVYAVGVLLLVIAAGVWWFKLSVTPERVFWGMVEQSLSTSGVTMQSTQKEGGTNLEQSVQFSLGADNRAVSLTKLEQSGTEVTTEILGTNDADYTRYSHIKTDRTDAQGQPLDLSKVIGVWAKTDNKDRSSTLISQVALGLSLPLGSLPVPIGNLNPEDRDLLVNQMRNENAYEVDFGKAKREVKDGRLQYTYEVTVQIIPYVNLMKRFAQSIGVHDLDNLDANSYLGSPPLVLEMTVDVRSKHLVAVHVPSTAYRQTFVSYDIPVTAKLPEKTVPDSELQKRLDELQ